MILQTNKTNEPNIEWNATLTGDFLWTNVNFGEAVTETMTPLTWSVIQFTLDDWIFLPGYPTVGNIGGTPYLNISVLATMFRAAGKDQATLLADLESTVYMQLPKEMDIPLIPLTARSLLSGIWSSMKVQNRQKRGLRQLQSYLDETPNWFRKMRGTIQTEKDKSALAALWHSEIKPHIKKGVWCVLGSAPHSASYALRLRRDLTDLIGPQDASILIANLSSGDELLASLGPVAGIAKLARGEMTRDDYLEQFGHRGPHEFEVSIPRQAEDPQWLDRELARCKESPVDVAAKLSAQRSAFDAAWKRLETRHPRKARSIRRRIAESAQRARARELARSEYIRDRWLIRLFALRAGELIGLGDDVFFLYLDEMLGLLEGSEGVTDVIPDRKKTHQRFKALPAYPPIIRGRFDPIQWAADPNRRTDIFDAQNALVAPTSQSPITGLITGSPGSAGQVEGIVRVIPTPEEGHQLQPGEIMVTIQTDIAWTLLFPRAAAVVTDVGAPLSHAAIVARELGIPAVVGCGDATARLKTGDRVRVDGGRGTVTILSA